MVDTKHVTDTIREIRSICTSFTEKGLPNYPMGIPFTYWEQYLNLRFYLMLSLLCVFVSVFLVLAVSLMNPWIAFVVVSFTNGLLIGLELDRPKRTARYCVVGDSSLKSTSICTSTCMLTCMYCRRNISSRVSSNSEASFQNFYKILKKHLLGNIRTCLNS